MKSKKTGNMLAGLDQSVKQFLTRYQNPEACRMDILRTVEQYKGLNVNLQPFAFQNGMRKELVNLSGTIPVPISGITYNIPICIWLMDTHPNNAPICYVKPTSDMLIKMSKYVDHTGKIYLPYLHEWKPSSSDLIGLIQVMIITFGEYPPVYSKPRTENNLPYPQQPVSAFMPMPYPQTHQSSDTSAGTAGGVRPYPPYSVMPSYPPYPPQQPQNVQQPTQSGMASGTITEEHIRASLLSAVEHKLKQKLDKQFDQSKAELEVLQQTANELAQGKAKLDAIFERLNKEKAELERNIQVLKEKDEELKESIAQLEEEEDIDVDEAVTTTAPLYKQILNAYAEEAATEDALYYLGEALRRGVIDLDVFLKQVRALSRKQFMLRALMQKCRAKAGLAC